MVSTLNMKNKIEKPIYQDLKGENSFPVYTCGSVVDELNSLLQHICPLPIMLQCIFCSCYKLGIMYSTIYRHILLLLPSYILCSIKCHHFIFSIILLVVYSNVFSKFVLYLPRNRNNINLNNLS